MVSEESAFKKINKILDAQNIPEYDVIYDIVDKVSEILENELASYRPSADDNTPGSLIKLDDKTVPMIVVPDLHARPDFLLNILLFKLEDGMSVFHALWEKKINIVFVGDILHSERNSVERWHEAETEFEQGDFTGPSMSLEMQKGLSLLCGLFMLKEFFPENCHILKGNHENILNVTENGDFSFVKYADEGEMCKIFIQEYYGDDILYLIHYVEKNLPLVAFGPRCVVSHAEPAWIFSEEEIINARHCKGVVQGLTWTANGDAEEGSASGVIENLAGVNNIDKYVYLGGHRPVAGKFQLRQNGMYIQIHNPSQQNIAIVDASRKFNPETDIFEVNK